jgi:hypothetical protein
MPARLAFFGTTGPTEVEILLVECTPIRPGKVIALVAGLVQIGCETEYSLAIPPVRSAKLLPVAEWPTADSDLIRPGVPT